MNDYVDLWNGDRSKLGVVADDVVVADPGIPGDRLQGRDAFEEHLEHLWAGFPDFHVEVTDAMERDGVIMGEWEASATHEGEFNRIPPTNRRMELHGMDRIVVEDGRIQEHHIYYDVQGMLEQLGVAEA